MTKLLEDVLRTMGTSELAAAIEALAVDKASLLFGDEVRDLTAGEIAQLQQQGNQAQDWAKLKVAQTFRPNHVWHNRFLGRVVLGSFSAARRDLGEGMKLRSGVTDSTLCDVEIGNEAVVARVGLMSSTLVHGAAAVVNCGSLTCPGETTYGCGSELSLAIETGGRKTQVYAEITVGIAEGISKGRGDEGLLANYQRLIEQYLDRVRCRWTIIAGNALVRETGQVVGSYVGPHAIVSNACRIANSCLLSSADEQAIARDGTIVERSILQWGAEAASMALIEKSVLCEHSHVERHGKVTESILGPNSGVGEGEVTASLVGPFLGFHHQALLIAAMWPEGKGNVGYGANVGSNHTGRAPDQEIWCGEGTFFGLGSNVKFPSDFTRSPYSIIATGVTCLAQRVEFPFSLINSPSQQLIELSPSINEIFPGWVLTKNIYMLKRNEAKYVQRNKARREAFVFTVMRPDTVELMQAALQRLQQAEGRPVYTAQQIPGLGKNFVTEASRLTAIAVYEFHIAYYARLGLKQQLVRRGIQAGSDQAAAILGEPSDDVTWEHQRAILREASDGDVPGLLRDLVERERTIAKEVEQSKAKDDARGAEIISDYELAHGSVDDDDFIRSTWRVYEALAAEVRQLLGG